MPNNNAQHGDELEGSTYTVAPDAGNQGIEVVAVSSHRPANTPRIGDTTRKGYPVAGDAGLGQAWLRYLSTGRRNKGNAATLQPGHPQAGPETTSI
jgi:hypothetical protein